MSSQAIQLRPVTELTQRVEQLVQQRITAATKPLTDQIEAQKAEIARMREQLAQYEDQGMRPDTKPERPRKSANNRGRSRAQDIIKLDGVEYWSVAYTAKQRDLSQATISRRGTSHAITYKQIGGTYYIPAHQASALNHKTKNAHR